MDKELEAELREIVARMDGKGEAYRRGVLHALGGAVPGRLGHVVAYARGLNDGLGLLLAACGLGGDNGRGRDP